MKKKYGEENKKYEADEEEVNDEEKYGEGEEKEEEEEFVCLVTVIAHTCFLKLS